MKLTRTLIYLLFLVLPFGQLERLSPTPLYLHDLIILSILGLNLKKIKLPRPLLLFGLAGVLSLAVNCLCLPFKELLQSSLYLWRWLAYAVFGLTLAAGKVEFKKPLLIFGLMLAIFGLVQYLVIPDTRFLAGLNWDDHYFRVIGTLFEPNYLGSILVLTLVLIFFKFSRLGYLYPLILTPLLLTYSRSSYLALLAAAGFLAISKKRLKYLLITICLLLVAVLILPRPGGEGVKLERLFSVQQRLLNYQEGLEIFKTAPVFGIGFNSLRYYRQDPVSHAASGLDNSFLFVAVTTGVVGLLAYLNLLKFLWKKSLLVKISLVVVIVHSFFQNTLFYPFVMIWLWSIVDD